VLASTRATEPAREAVRSGLREHDLVEGRNLLIEWRDGEGHFDRLAVLARELVQRRVDVIVAMLTPAVQAAKNATSTIPIVMAPVGDPVASGFVVSLARPGRNLTGVTGIGAELAGKQLEALRQLLPRLARVALLVNPAGDAFSTALTTHTETAAATPA
jgi:putative ABC transport system substrate-binding protein